MPRRITIAIMRNTLRGCFVAMLLTALAVAQTSEQRATHYLDSIRKQPGLLLDFVHELPKGGDLHNHLDGAIYAEDFVDFAASGGLCVDRTSSRLLAPPCDSCETYTAKPAARCGYVDHVLYNQMIDAWSMRNWRPGDESGHDHFFAAFNKFGLARHTHVAEGESLPPLTAPAWIICNTSNSCTLPTPGARPNSQGKSNGIRIMPKCATPCSPPA